MAHQRKLLGWALALNTLVLVVETVSGLQANSLSLLIDAIHNLSDEVALLFLFLAYVFWSRRSTHLLRSANFFNTIGLLLLSGFLFWQALERLFAPQPVWGWLPIVAGVVTAAGNLGVALALRAISANSASIRLAYIHNIGDSLLSLAPVGAGIAVLITGNFIFDSLLAAVIAVWIIVSTLREVMSSGEQLLWPEDLSSAHTESLEAEQTEQGI